MEEKGLGKSCDTRSVKHERINSDYGWRLVNEMLKP